jgi:hypothetical protein
LARRGLVTGTEVQVRAVGARPGRLPSVEVKPSPSGVTVTAASVQNVTVLPMTVNLFIYQGDDFYLDLLVNDSAGNPIDITNMQPLSQIRAVPNGPLVFAELLTTVDATETNLLHLQLQAADSAGLPALPATCAWDVQLSSPDIVTLAFGTVNVTPQVTQ